MDSNDADQFARLAMGCHQRGELDQAIGYYQKLLAIKPGFAQVHYNLGIAFSALGRLDEAVASDALWVGVPVVTCSGEAFAARMVGSLLHTVGLPELITHNLEDYENLALKLAVTPELLTDIRRRLAENRRAYPLFDTRRFCRHLETAYAVMHERTARGKSPACINVSSSD